MAACGAASCDTPASASWHCLSCGRRWATCDYHEGSVPPSCLCKHLPIRTALLAEPEQVPAEDIPQAIAIEALVEPGSWHHPDPSDPRPMGLISMHWNGGTLLSLDTCYQAEPVPPLHVALYFTATADIELTLLIALTPELAMLQYRPEQLLLGQRRYVIPCSPKTLAKASTGHSESVKVQRPERANTVDCSENEVPVPIRIVERGDGQLRCQVTLPQELVSNIGVIDLRINGIRWSCYAPTPFLERGSSSSKQVGDVAEPCPEQAKQRKRPLDVVQEEEAGEEDDLAQRGVGSKRSRAADQDVTLIQHPFDQIMRLSLLRICAEPVADAYTFDADIRRFTPFLTFKHMFHACVWANGTPAGQVRNPFGVVYQVVQNVRLIHNDWLQGRSEKAGKLPYPTDSNSAVCLYDTNNEGWNLLDNPVPTRRSGQCNQVASLLVEVLAMLGIQGEVLELERLYAVHGGATVMRNIMSGDFMLHGLLSVDFGGQTWCYDSTMTHPPERWMGTLAKAKTFATFTQFKPQDWRYQCYQGVNIPEDYQQVAELAPLALHLPATLLGQSAVAGNWSVRPGNIPFARLPPKWAATLADYQAVDVANGRSEQTVQDWIARQVTARAAFRIQVDNQTMVAPFILSDAQRAVSPVHYVLPKAEHGQIVISAIGDAAGQTSWTINGAAQAPGASISLELSVAERYLIVGSNNGISDTIVVWVCWATLEILVDGDLPADCRIDFSKSAITTNPRRLGVVCQHDFDPDKDIMPMAVGRAMAVARLLPDDVGEVLGENSLTIRRRIVNEITWADGVAAVAMGDDDDAVAGTKTMQLKPSAQHRIYVADAPNVTRFEGALFFVETYMNFCQWVEWKGTRISADAHWHFIGTWAACGKNRLPIGDSVEVNGKDYDPWVAASVDVGPVPLPPAAGFVVAKGNPNRLNRLR